MSGPRSRFGFNGQKKIHSSSFYAIFLRTEKLELQMGQNSGCHCVSGNTEKTMSSRAT